MLLGTAPFAFAMALVHDAAGYVAVRCMVGLGLSMFVVNQTWTTCMFNVKLVGRANALSAGAADGPRSVISGCVDFGRIHASTIACRLAFCLWASGTHGAYRLASKQQQQQRHNMCLLGTTAA
jgi:hypothetical protein